MEVLKFISYIKKEILSNSFLQLEINDKSLINKEIILESNIVTLIRKRSQIDLEFI